MADPSMLRAWVKPAAHFEVRAGSLLGARLQLPAPPAPVSSGQSVAAAKQDM